MSNEIINYLIFIFVGVPALAYYAWFYKNLWRLIRGKLQIGNHDYSRRAGVPVPAFRDLDERRKRHDSQGADGRAVEEGKG